MGFGETLSDCAVSFGDLDGFVRAGLIAVGVGASGAEVGYVDAFHGHGEGSFVVVYYTSCPFDCAVGV